MKKTKNSKTGLVLGTAFLGLMAGCVGYVGGQREAVYAPAPSVYVESGIAAQDDYVYYPAYQVYYSSERQQYVYLDGGSWVSRAAAPRVSANVLFASASVKVDFHDSPANHNAEIVKQYPTHWTSPASNRANPENNPADDKARHEASRAPVNKEPSEQITARQPARQEKTAPTETKKAQQPVREQAAASEKNNANQADNNHDNKP